MSKQQPPVAKSDGAPISDPIQPDPEQPKADQPKAEETPLPTKARVLVDVTVAGELYCSGMLLQAAADIIAGLGDQVDVHPEAVAYCEKITNG